MVVAMASANRTKQAIFVYVDGWLDEEEKKTKKKQKLILMLNENFFVEKKNTNSFSRLRR